MSLPYFQLYPTDYEADTAHLTLEEDGAYNRILRLMWMTPGCSLPDDAGWIARRMRVDMVTFLRLVEPILAEFCQRKNGRIISPRLQREWKKADETSRKRSDAGKRGGRPKAIDAQGFLEKVGISRDKAGPKHPEPYPEPYPEPEPLEKREAKASPKKLGSRLAADWSLPDGWAVWASGQGVDMVTIRREAERFADYWHGLSGAKATKLDWEATWRNWVRSCADRNRPRPPEPAPVQHKIRARLPGEAQ